MTSSICCDYCRDTGCKYCQRKPTELRSLGLKCSDFLSAETLQRVTTLAMEKAVALGMVPRFSSEEEYLMHWDNMTELVKTILAVE